MGLEREVIQPTLTECLLWAGLVMVGHTAHPTVAAQSGQSVMNAQRRLLANPVGPWGVIKQVKRRLEGAVGTVREGRAWPWGLTTFSFLHRSAWWLWQPRWWQRWHE